MWAKCVLFLVGLTVVKSEVSYINLRQFKNYSVPDLDTICSYFPTAKNVSENCGEQLEIVCRNATLIMTMLDASSKLPYTGMGYSSKMDYGNFDQCLTIDHKYEGGRILGEHCVGALIIPDLLGNSTDEDSAYKLSVCRPNGCTSSDFSAVIENLLEEQQLPLFFMEGSCQTIESNSTWTSGAIATLTVFLVVIGIMILSTTYDIYLYRAGNKCAHPLLISFSVLTNGRKLMHISKHSSSKEQIEVFHGLRVISMMWIVAGHAIVTWEEIPVLNPGNVAKWLREMYALYIASSPLAVDTFFFMSGFLLAFQYFKGKARTLKEQVMSIPHMIIHRYLSLSLRASSRSFSNHLFVSLTLMGNLVNTMLWVVAILGLLAVVICYQDEGLHHGSDSNAVFSVLMRPAWSIGLSWITYSCYHGHGGFINWILCRPIFQVLARLTYCIYLTHITVIGYYIATARNTWFFTDYNEFYLFCGHYIVTLIVSTFWTLAFESPLLVIEKYLLGGVRKPKEPTPHQNGNKEEPPA